MQRWKRVQAVYRPSLSSNRILPCIYSFRSSPSLRLLSTIITSFSTSSSSSSIASSTDRSVPVRPYRHTMETLFSGGLQSPSVDRRGHILPSLSSSSSASVSVAYPTIPTSTSSVSSNSITLSSSSSLSTITRSSPDYWSTLLEHPSTQIILLHDLRPIIIEQSVTAAGTPSDSTISERNPSISSSTASLLRLSVDQLNTVFPSLFASSLVTDTSTIHQRKSFIVSDKFIPICLGTMRSSTTSDDNAPSKISFPLIAIDIGTMMPNRKDVLEKLQTYFVTSLTNPSSLSSSITILIPEARDYLVGSLMKNKVQPIKNHPHYHNELTHPSSPPSSTSNLYPSSSFSSSSSSSSSLLSERVRYSDLPLSSIDWSLPYNDICLYGTARSLFIWHDRSKYCGSCGGLTVPIEGGIKRRCSNNVRHHPTPNNTTDTTAPSSSSSVSSSSTSSPTVCRETLYPRTDPVVITLVQNYQGTHILLARSKGFPPAMYSCLAGFVEPGETLEEAAAREVYEETGIIIDHVTYLGSQPWPLGRGVFGQLMVGFIATARPTIEKSSSSSSLPILTIDPDELEDARWYTTDEILASFTKWYPVIPTNGIMTVTNRPTEPGTRDDRSPPLALVVTSTSNSSSSVPISSAPYTPSSTTTPSPGSKLFLPGPFAIAHQLIKEWLMGTRPRL